jgi:hypothetical protein
MGINLQLSDCAKPLGELQERTVCPARFRLQVLQIGVPYLNAKQIKLDESGSRILRAGKPDWAPRTVHPRTVPYRAFSSRTENVRYGTARDGKATMW